MKQTLSKRKEIIEEAKNWVGTPYLHQARVKGLTGGVDCAMLVAGIAYNVGIINDEIIKRIPPYPVQWNMHSDFPLLTTVMESFGCLHKNNNEKQPGDILVFKIGRVPAHLAVLIENDFMVHAYGGSINKVIVSRFDERWIKRWKETYTFPGED